MQIRVKGQLVYLPMEKQYVKYAQQAKQLLHASVVKSGEDLVVKFSDPSVARKFAEKIADPMNIQYESVISEGGVRVNKPQSVKNGMARNQTNSQIQKRIANLQIAAKKKRELNKKSSQKITNPDQWESDQIIALRDVLRWRAAESNRKKKKLDENTQSLTEWTLSDVQLAMRKAGLTHDIKIMVDRLRQLPNFDPSHITLNDLRKVDLATSKSGYSTQTQRELEKMHGGIKEGGSKDIQRGKIEAQIKELTKLVYRLEKDMENEDDDEHYDHLEDIQSKAQYKIEMLEKQLKQLGENTIRSFIRENVSKLLEAEDNVVYVVYMRFTPKHHWSLNLVERDLERAKKLAAKWKQQQIEYGKKNGKNWNVQVAIDPVVNPSGDVAKMDNKKSLSPKAMMI